MIRTLYPLLLLLLLVAGACSYILPQRTVECCENKAACCFEQMCCLPRYAVAAGKEPKPFTTNIPVYGTSREEDLQPPPGAVVVKKGWLARLNPFGSADDGYRPRSASPDTTASTSQEEKSIWDRLWPF